MIKWSEWEVFRGALEKFMSFNLKGYIKLNIYNLKVVKYLIKWSEEEVFSLH